jgi:hypothetical protein
MDRRVREEEFRYTKTSTGLDQQIISRAFSPWVRADKGRSGRTGRPSFVAGNVVASAFSRVWV